MNYLLLQGDARRIPLKDESVSCVVTSPPYLGLRSYLPDGHPLKDREIGLEPTPDEFVATMIQVFREVRRALHPSGTLWLNLGDSYAGGGGGNYSESAKQTSHGEHLTNIRNRGTWLRSAGLKAKDLCGVPWRVAFALRDDGWYLRSEITWCKTSPMPESVTDRPTSATEKLFLLTKSPSYYYDIDAVRVPSASSTLERDKYTRITSGKDGQYAVQHDHETPSNPDGRNLWNYWVLGAENYPGAHFATYPKKLVEPCIKAGCPVGGLVFDPFNGSGTTGVVSLALGRRYIGMDLSADYLGLARQRIDRPHQPIRRKKTADFPLFAGMDA